MGELRLPAIQIDEAQPGSITHEFQGGMNPEFGHDISPVVLHGLDRDIEQAGNLFGGLAFRNEAQNLLFPGREAAVGRLVSLALAA